MRLYASFMQHYFCISINSINFPACNCTSKFVRFKPGVHLRIYWVYAESMHLILCKAILCSMLFVDFLKPLVQLLISCKFW